jgi:hypothetical protein
MARVAIACPVNREDILAQCLAASPDVVSGALSLSTYRGWSRFGPLGNHILAEAHAAWLIIVHQDVYLPAGFAARLDNALDWLEEHQPNAAILGVGGVGVEGKLAGRAWSSGLGQIVGNAEGLPRRVQSLDEMLIIVRVDTGLRFDEAMPGFHLYGTDLVLSAAQQGKSAWVADLPTIHHSHAVVQLGGDFARAWRFLQKKWHMQLPLPNLVCTVTHSGWPLLLQDFRVRRRMRGARVRPAPVGDPAEIAARLGWAG